MGFSVLGFREPPIDVRTSFSQRCTFAFITVCIPAFLVAQVMLRPLTNHHGLHWALQSTGPVIPQEQPRQRFPPALAPVITQPSGKVHVFTVPTVIAYYADALPDNRTKLYLITSGIMMKVSQRDLNAVACQVGDDIYPASIFITEILHCVIPRRLRRGERLVAVLAWDDRLQRAAKAPVTLSTGVVAEILPGDIGALPESAVLHGELASAKREAFRVVRSDVRVGASDGFDRTKSVFHPRYRLCLMTMVAPNSHMLKDWADYHRRIGVDQVYIFDNGAALDLEKMFEDRIDVEIVPWPYHKSQVQAVSMFMFAARLRCERVLLEDSDEYPMFGLGDGNSWRAGDPPLIRHAKKVEKEGFLNYKLLHIVMINSGFLHRPKGEIPMNFIHRRRNQIFRNGKSVCYMDLEWQAGGIHHCGEVNGTKQPIHKLDIHDWGEMKMTPEEPDDPPFLMHFRDRSWEEYIEKWDAGRVAGKLVADEKAGSMTMEDPDRSYMRVRPELEYTHFRDTIYKRVLRDGTLDEQTIVQTKDGKRCESLYRIGKTAREFVHEICV